MAAEGDSQRDSNEAPSPAPPPAALRLSLSAEEKASLLAEIDRLQATSVICKVAGFRPSRGEMRDLLQARLLADVGKIVDVQTLGRSFYQIEFEASDMAARVLQLSPLTLRAGRAYFRPWRHGFDPTTEVVEEASFPVSVCLPGLRREYLHLLPQIGGIFGVTLETPRTAASVAAKAAGLPSVRVLISDPSALPKEIFLPAASGAWFRQRVEFTGLPNQCFVCRKIGHLAKACPRRQTRSASRTGTGTGTGTGPAPPEQRPPPPPPTGSTGVPPTGQATSGGGDPSTERQQPEEGWQTFHSRRRGEGGGRPPAPPTQQWVPTGNRFSVLREEVPTGAPDIGPSSRPTSSPGSSEPSSSTSAPPSSPLPDAAPPGAASASFAASSPLPSAPPPRFAASSPHSPSSSSFWSSFLFRRGSAVSPA